MLARIGIVILIGIVVLVEAAIVAVMRDSAHGNKHLFHKWLIIWAAVNTTIVVVGYYILTGTLLGIEL